MRRIYLFITLIPIILISFLLLFGKLFPFSPIILGFEKQESERVVFYLQRDCHFNDFDRVDSLIPLVEDFHNMEFMRKPEIFLFKDSICFIRHSLSRARFCVYYNGRLFASPWAMQEDSTGTISLDIYLRHELSHSLQFQHAGVYHSIRYPEWLLEGIATYSADQMGTSFYPSKLETLRLISEGNFLPPEDFKTKREKDTFLDVPNRIPFMYSEFGCIVDYLIDSYGREKFLYYMKSLVEGGDFRKEFNSIYSLEFATFLTDFLSNTHEDHISSGS